MKVGDCPCHVTICNQGVHHLTGINNRIGLLIQPKAELLGIFYAPTPSIVSVARKRQRDINLGRGNIRALRVPVQHFWNGIIAWIKAILIRCLQKTNSFPATRQVSSLMSPHRTRVRHPVETIELGKPVTDLIVIIQRLALFNFLDNAGQQRRLSNLSNTS